MKKNYNIRKSEFYCCKCGRRGLDIHRRPSQQREAGHLKKLFCLYCKEEVNHAEVDPDFHYTKEDFMLEFKYHNFDENQNRKESLNSLKARLEKEGVNIYE